MEARSRKSEYCGRRVRRAHLARAPLRRGSQFDASYLVLHMLTAICRVIHHLVGAVLGALHVLTAICMLVQHVVGALRESTILQRRKHHQHGTWDTATGADESTAASTDDSTGGSSLLGSEGETGGPAAGPARVLKKPADQPYQEPGGGYTGPDTPSDGSMEAAGHQTTQDKREIENTNEGDEGYDTASDTPGSGGQRTATRQRRTITSVDDTEWQRHTAEGTVLQGPDPASPRLESPDTPDSHLYSCEDTYESWGVRLNSESPSNLGGRTRSFGSGKAHSTFPQDLNVRLPRQKAPLSTCKGGSHNLFHNKGKRGNTNRRVVGLNKRRGPCARPCVVIPSPGQFTGSPQQNFRMWKIRVRLFLKSIQATRGQAASILPLYLQGPALLLYADMGPEIQANHEEVFKALEASYASAGREALHFTELQKCRQGHVEAPFDYYARMAEHLSLAEVRDPNLKFQYFVQGLRRDLKRVCRPSNVTNIEDALTLCLQVEQDSVQ